MKKASDCTTVKFSNLIGQFSAEETKIKLQMSVLWCKQTLDKLSSKDTDVLDVKQQIIELSSMFHIEMDEHNFPGRTRTVFEVNAKESSRDS